MNETKQTLRAIIDLDKSSGKFELDVDGYVKLVPPKGTAVDDWQTLKDINRWIASEMDKASAAMEPMFAEAAKNQETYKPINVQIENDGGTSILPSPIARTVADQIIASTVNNILRPSPIVSVDAYFPADYDVIIPIDADEIRAAGVSLAPNEDGSEVSGPVPTPGTVDSETLARRFEKALEFKLRERLNFAEALHKIVHYCVTGAPPYWKVYKKQQTRTVIGTKSGQTPFVDPNKEQEYQTNGEIVCMDDIIPFQDVLRPNLHQKMDDLEWYAQRDPKTPDEMTRDYEAGKLFLLKDKDDAEACAACCMTEIEEIKARVDAGTKKYDPRETARYCDVWEVPFYYYLKIAAEEDEKPTVRRFSLMGSFHRGMRKFLAIYRNPYNHQRRWIVPFVQFLDGGSTVGIMRHSQQLQTVMTQMEVLGAFHAANPVYWKDPDSPNAVNVPNRAIHAGEVVSAVYGKDWGTVQRGFDHYSLLNLLQWNEAGGDKSAHSSDYEQGGRVVSHTSPQTVSTMLDRGGQNEVLFLRSLDRGVREVIKLYLETSRQFAPMGENIPVRNPKDRALIMVPFYYPISEMMDVFRISLTAADEAASRERDPDQMAANLQLHQNHTMYVAQVMQAMRDPSATAEDMALLRKMLEGEQTLYERIIATTRADEEKFDLMPEIDDVITAKEKILAQMKEQQANGATGQTPNPVGTIPNAQQGAVPPGSAGSGAEPGMAQGAPAPPAGGGSPPIP